MVTFLTQHLGNEVPSPALFKRIGDRLHQAVAAFAAEQAIPLLRLNGGLLARVAGRDAAAGRRERLKQQP